MEIEHQIVPIISRGRDCEEFNVRSNEALTLNEIDEYSNRILAKHKDEYKGYKVNIVTFFSDVVRRSSWQRIEGKVRGFRWTDYEYEVPDHVSDDMDIHNFKILLLYDPAEGGLDEHNDCLFNCIEKAVGKTIIQSKINKPWKFKKFLGLERNDLVPVSCVAKIEELMVKYSIYVTGDEIYTSPYNRNLKIDLVLSEGHYRLRCKKGRTHTGGVCYEAIAKENVYSYIKDAEGVLICDGKINRISDAEFGEMKTCYKYLFLNCDSKENKRDKRLSKLEDDEKLIKVRELFILMADELFEMSNGVVNMYKFRSAYNGSRELFRMRSKSVPIPDDIGQSEANIINKSFNGGLMYAKKGYKGFGIEYDFNSMYAYCMSIHAFQFPVRAGEFVRLTDEVFKEMKYFKYGCYHCVVERSGDEDINKLFKFNSFGKDNWYTHHSLECAKRLGLKMTIILDGEANFLYYSKDKLVSGKNVFGEFMNYVLKLKKKTKYAKQFYLKLWGGLSQKNKRTYYHNYNEIRKPFEIKDGYGLVDYSERDGLYKINVEDRNKLFMTTFGRISCFLTSYVRNKVAKLVEKFKDKIVHIHTDGFVITEEVEVKTGVEAGDISEKKRGKCFIKNVNSVKFY